MEKKIINLFSNVKNDVREKIFEVSKNNKLNIEGLFSSGYSNYLLPKFNADYVISNLYLDGLYSRCVKVLVGDVFKDYKLIGKVNRKVNKVEEFVERSDLFTSFVTAFEDYLSYGYGCILIRRDNLGSITRFSHLPSNKIGVIFNDSGEKKYVLRRDYFNNSDVSITNYFNVYGKDTIELGRDEVFMFNDYYIKDPIYGIGNGVKVAGLVELKAYLDTMVIGTLLKNVVRPNILVNIKTGVNTDSEGEIISIDNSELGVVRDKISSQLNNGLSEGDIPVLSTDFSNIVLDIMNLNVANSGKEVIDISDHIDTEIMRAFGVPATRLVAFKSGVFSGNMTKESLEMYGYNTILNYQRLFEKYMNMFIKDLLGEKGKRVGSVEIELERFKTDYSQVLDFDIENEQEVIEDNKNN